MIKSILSVVATVLISSSALASQILGGVILERNPEVLAPGGTVPYILRDVRTGATVRAKVKDENVERTAEGLIGQNVNVGGEFFLMPPLNQAVFAIEIIEKNAKLRF